MQAPERDAIDRVAVLHEDAEQLRVRLGLGLKLSAVGGRRWRAAAAPAEWPPPAPLSVTSSSVIATFSFSAL